MTRPMKTHEILRKVADFIVQEPQAYDFGSSECATALEYQGKAYCVLGWANALLPEPLAQEDLNGVARALGFSEEAAFYFWMRVFRRDWSISPATAVPALHRLAEKLKREEICLES